MATVAEIEQQIAALRARLGALEDAKIAVQAEIERLTFQAVDLRSAARRQREGGDIAGADVLRAQAQALDDKAAGLYNSQAFRDVDTAESEIRRLENELYNAQQKAKFEAYQEKQTPTPEERTAQQKAESDQTTPVVDKPAPVQPEVTGDVNPPPTAEKPQQTSQPIAQDDNPQTAVQTTVQQQTNTAGNLNSSGFITPRPNVLDKFASTTWTASVYLLSPAQYKELIRSRKKRVNGYNLLFQSGGAPNNVGGFQGASNPAYQAKTTVEGGNQSVAPGVPGGSGPDAGRNPAFTQDFYIDSVTFDNYLPGKQTQMAHSVFDLKFTVVEPGNITLLDRIYAAVQDMAQTTGNTNQINYTAAQYLMVIRWYGYDINGNLIAGRTAPDQNGISDTNAIVEKFIPFLIKKVNWSVSSKLVSYDFECVPVGHLVAGGTRRGTIPYDVQLTGQTVENLLSGPVIYASKAPPGSAPGTSTTTAPTKYVKGTASRGGASTTDTERTQVNPGGLFGAGSTQLVAKASSAPTPKTTLTSGLASAMSVFAADLVSVEKVYKAADTYSVVFADNADEIKNAEIVLPGSVITQYETAMGISVSIDPNQALNTTVNPTQIKTRKWGITAGMQFVQAIDLAIRNSSYIYNQALTVWDQTTQQEIPNPQAQGKPVSWYKITMQATPGDYDPARNDFAYDITYIISKYEIPNFNSIYFPIGRFRGIHKRYPYWFTGENTAVLDFTANFNAAYNMTISGGPDVNSAEANLRRAATSNTRDQLIYTYAARSQESNKGADGKGMELGANAAEYLYAYSEPGGSRMRIIGDPAWIQQGSLCGGVTSSDLSDSPFDADGTINFDSSQILYEIAWQRPEDYDLNTGLADPYARPGNTPGQPIQTNTYQATKVTNEFRGGKFEQIITGVLYMIPIPKAAKQLLTTSYGSVLGAGSAQVIAQASGVQTEDDNANRLRDLEAGQSRGTRPQAATGSADSVSGSVNPYASAGRFAASVQTGTPTLPAVDLAGVVTNPSKFTAAPPLPPDLLAVARYPQAPTGAGVQPLSSQDAPLPLNTTLQNVRTRIQRIVKDQ